MTSMTLKTTLRPQTVGAAMRWVKPGNRTILIVEPDGATLAEVTTVLAIGLRVMAARTAAEAMEHLERIEPHLVLTSYVLPDLPGIDLCRRIRASSARSVIFISGLDADAEALASYAAGADGYIRKPFRLRELDARVTAALRHSRADDRFESTAVSVGDVTLDLERHEVQVRGRAVALPLREFQLLGVLLGQPGKVWSRELLIRRLWGETPLSGTKSLDVHVRRIRGRIEDDPSRPTRILTVRGVGYRYAVPAGPR